MGQRRISGDYCSKAAARIGRKLWESPAALRDEFGGATSVASWVPRALHKLLLILLAVGPFAQCLAATQYAYDDLGRLVLVVNPDGGSTVYTYDANGNVSAIVRSSSSTVAVASFTPAYGPAGTQVTISGSGFDPTPSSNSVTIGGAAATVTDASALTLVATVPLGADTGPIAVTVAGNTGTSAQSFVVLKPEIAGFSPTLVDAGTAITLTGTNLNLSPGSTTVSVGTTAVTISSISNTQVVFTAPSGASGHVNVSTPYGQATSSQILTVVPTGIGAANVVASSAIDPNGGPQTLDIGQQNRYGLFEFDAVAGQWLTMQVSSLTTSPSGGTVQYQVYTPAGTTFSYGTLSSSNVSLDLPEIPTTGTYLVSFASGNNTSASVTATLELNSTLEAGSSLNVSTAVPRQHKRFVFSANAGESFGLAVTGLTLTPASPNYVVVRVYQPNGYQWTSAYCYTTTSPGCSLALRNAPLTGEYTVRVDPPGASTMDFALTFSEDAGGMLSPGMPVNAAFDVPGQQALLTFTATAGDTKAVYLGSIATTPTGKSVAIYAYAPNGSQVGYATTTTTTTLNLSNLTAGTYTVLLLPQDGATGSAQVTLADGLTGTLPTDGTTENVSATVPAQNAYFTFSATAGDDLGLALTGLTLTPSSQSSAVIHIFMPSGYQLVSQYCSPTTTPGCALALPNVPETGNYLVRVDSPAGVTMAFAMTLSQDIAGTPTPGSPFPLTFGVPGREAALTFTATAGDIKAVLLSSIATTPAGKAMTMRLFLPNGSEIGLGGVATTTTQTTLNLTNLSAGTYTLVVIPQDAATGSAQITLADGLTGTLPTDGTTENVSSTVPAQNAYFTFSATAGDNLGLALTGLTFTPSSQSSAVIHIFRPSGYQLAYQYCSPTTMPGCAVALPNVPETGNYLVRVDSPAGVTMAFEMTLSQDLTGTLSLGTPLGVSLTLPGEEAALTFTATAGQSAALSMSSITTTPTGKAMTMRLFLPSGSELGLGGGATSTTQTTVNLTNLSAGTYTVVVVPQDAATGSVQMEIQ